MKRFCGLILLVIIGITFCNAQSVSVSDSLLKSADEFFEHKDYIRSVKLYKEASMQGNLDALNKLGFCYMYGTGVTRNAILAANCFKRAAEKGFVKAEFNLANCYYMGQGIAINHKKSAEWMLKAAEQNYEPAMQNMATYYKQGIGVMFDNEQADFWNKKWQKTSAEVLKTEQPQTVDDSVSVADASQPIQVDLSSAKTKDKSVVAHTGVQNTTIANDKQSIKVSPGIKILYPINQSLFHEESITIKYQILNGNEQNTKVTVLIDGIRQPVNRAVKAANTLEVDLPKKDCSIMLMVQNQNGYGEPTSIQLIWDKSYDDVILPNLYVLSIGIGKYSDSKLPPLKYSVKDATDIAESLMKKKGKPYGNVQVKLLCDEYASRMGIFDGLTWLKEHATPNDVCIFFYAGHGFRDEKDRFYFVPIDGKTDKTYSCFSANDFKTMAEDIRGKIIVFTDACYSAALMEGNRSAATDHFIEQLRRTRDGVFLIASSSADTKSKEDDAWGNGAFTKALVEAINGAAYKENSEGLTLMDLQLYLDKRVGDLTNHKQVPVAINPNGIENFSLFLYDVK